MACAKKTPKVANIPGPQVLFLIFGENSLGLELRAWLLDIGERLNWRSQLHQEIDRWFKKSKIEIAFLQKDLHLLSVDEPTIFGIVEPFDIIQYLFEGGEK